MLYRRLRPARHLWTHFRSILDRRTLEHDAGLDAEAKRALFKRNVERLGHAVDARLRGIGVDVS